MCIRDRVYIPASQGKPTHIKGTQVGKDAAKQGIENQQGAETDHHGQIQEQFPRNQTQAKGHTVPVPVLSARTHDQQICRSRRTDHENDKRPKGQILLQLGNARLLHLYGCFECGAIRDAFNISLQMRHIVTNAAQTVAHETGMAQHDIRGRKVADHIVPTL